MQKGVFSIIPDSWNGDKMLTVRTEKYTGRIAPAPAKFRLKKVGGGITSGIMNLTQPSYPEFFKIDSVEAVDTSNGGKDITVVCTGNVDISTVQCAATDFYGLTPTSGKQWEIKVDNATVGRFVPTELSGGLGVTLNGDSDFGKERQYQIVAYLSAPANVSSGAREYDFYFGVPTWGNVIPTVGNGVPTSKTLDKASNHGGKIIVSGKDSGSISIGPKSISFTRGEVGEEYSKSIRVSSGGSTWEIDPTTVESWFEIRIVSGGFLVIPLEENSDTSNRVANVKVRLTTGSKFDTLQITQQGNVSTSIYTHCEGRNYVEFNSRSNSFPVSVSASGPWEFNSLPSWMSISSIVGTTSNQWSAIATVAVESIDDTTYSREHTLTATLEGTGLSSSVTFKQINEVIAPTGSSAGSMTADSSGLHYYVTIPAGGTDITDTIGIDANCIWSGMAFASCVEQDSNGTLVPSSSTAPFTHIVSSSDSYTYALHKQSASNTLSVSLLFTGAARFRQISIDVIWEGE